MGDPFLHLLICSFIGQVSFLSQTPFLIGEVLQLLPQIAIPQLKTSFLPKESICLSSTCYELFLYGRPSSLLWNCDKGNYIAFLCIGYFIFEAFFLPYELNNKLGQGFFYKHCQISRTFLVPPLAGFLFEWRDSVFQICYWTGKVLYSCIIFAATIHSSYCLPISSNSCPFQVIILWLFLWSEVGGFLWMLSYLKAYFSWCLAYCVCTWAWRRIFMNAFLSESRYFSWCLAYCVCTWAQKYIIFIGWAFGLWPLKTSWDF